MKSLFGIALVGAAALSSQAYADPYSCQADLVLRNGQIITTSIGDGFTQRQACQNALNQCQDDLLRYQQQGYYRYATCRIASYDPGPVTPVPGPGPFPPNPGPFPPNPGPFPPNPGNSFEISCASNNYNVNYCYVGPYAYDIRLVARYSSSPCQFGRSYGLTGEYVWVSEGCRGTFAVRTR